MLVFLKHLPSLTQHVNNLRSSKKNKVQLSGEAVNPSTDKKMEIV